MSLTVTISRKLNVIAALVAGVVSVYVGSTAFEFGRQIAGANLPEVAQAEQLARISNAVAGLKEQVLSTQKQVALHGRPVGTSIDVEHYKGLEANIDRISSRLEALEKVIMTDPAKALQVPLIQRDLEALKAAQQIATAQTKDAVDRIYDLNKWLFGGMAISVMTLAIGNLLRGRSSATGSTDD
jgi:hypothetical protein